jgi:hypothetical protein
MDLILQIPQLILNKKKVKIEDGLPSVVGE